MQKFKSFANKGVKKVMCMVEIDEIVVMTNMLNNSWERLAKPRVMSVEDVEATRIMTLSVATKLDAILGINVNRPKVESLYIDEMIRPRFRVRKAVGYLIKEIDLLTELGQI